ncbi:A-kinase anchor protein 12 isoform X2 [Cavia porcellus]|uniref:A-kinase anchoring protein 12 n=1 Tax=Cavia porcellus TaxID=10141 RepID=H0V5Q1_CAVPO|nr:A-kinase anchor protein 12 isoform X2 [Cavia porcellus]
MGAGSSSRQRGPEQAPAGGDAPAEPEPCSGPSEEAAPDPAADPAIAATDPATKLLQKNGQLSTVNGLAEQGELTLQEGAQNGQEEEAIVTEVGQREPEDVSKKDLDNDTAANSVIVEDITKDKQEEMPEMIEQIPSSESHSEKMTRPTEANDVGEPHAEETEEAAAREGEGKQSVEKAEDTLKHQQSDTEIPLTAESGQAAAEGKDEAETTQEKEAPKPPESPTSPIASETTSTFKKFFTQGWAGWRKKTSFRKPKEDELETSEKKKEQEPVKADTEENEKAEDASEQPPASEQLQKPGEGADEARLSADYEKVELPLEDQVDGVQGPPAEKCAPLATEVFDEKIETHHEVVAEVHVSSTEKKAEEQEADVGEVEVLSSEKLLETNAQEAQEAELAEALEKTKEVPASGGDHARPTELSTEEKVLPKHPESIVSEVALLSSQDRVKVQGSPLKKLFSSTGLKKLSGKKPKGKRGGGGGGDEEAGENNQGAAESPDSADEQKGESSASSPEEPEEITCLEKGVPEGHLEGEAEEGATSDGEKKREGVTPWASFKKMVTPKKRVRRPSESDKEDELDKLDKVKSATLSSTESAASEMQEEIKGAGEEPKPEEPKRKVDTSVSWEALICVGSSKKRARKASSSDEEGGPKMMAGDGHKTEETARDKEARTDSVPAGTQEPDQVQGSSSPEPAGSPSEGEGVSTWESFKRLVTPRKKPKSKQEEKNEDTCVEHSALDVEPGKEESWVSIKKFIPGRRKKRSDGKQDQAAAGDTGPAEGNEEDSDVPSVVPLSEYDAVEREKMEAQRAPPSEAESVSEELSKNLAPCAAVAAADGIRAVTNVEERSPSWISASVTEPLEQAQDEATPVTGEMAESEVTAEETAVATETVSEGREVPDDTITSEVGLTPEAVTAAETTEMVSAVSQLTDSPNTTEEATPVQEVEGGGPDAEEQERQTQAVLQAVAEKVKEKSRLPDSIGAEGVTLLTVQRAEPKALEKVEEAEDSVAPGPKEEMDAAMRVTVQETKTEHFTLGQVAAQAAPESSEEGPQVMASVPRGLVTMGQSEPLAEVQASEQPLLPDSADTLTDSETNGSTPVADVEVLEKMQQDEVMVGQEDSAAVSGPQSQVAEAAPAQKAGPSAPPAFQSQEKCKEQLKPEGVLEHVDQELSVEAAPILSKTEVIEEARQLADGEHEDRPTQVASQEKTPEVPLRGELIEGAEFQQIGTTELQSPGPEEGERVAQVEKEKTDAKAVQGREEEEEAEPKSIEGLGQKLVQLADVLITDQEKEPSDLQGSCSPPPPGQEEKTTCQGQSPEVSVTVTAAVVEEEGLGETGQISETSDASEPAGARLEPAEGSSGKDALAVGPEPQAESEPVITLATPEKDLLSGLGGEESAFQKQKGDREEGQICSLEAAVSPAAEGSPKAESQILELETESSKLVQNIIQTAVDQFARTEEAAVSEAFPCDTVMEASQVPADSQGVRQKPVGEVRAQQMTVQDQTLTVTTPPESKLPTDAPELSDIAKDVNGTSEKTLTVEVGSFGVHEQHLEEVLPPGTAEGDDSCAKSGERIDKLPLDSKDDQKGDVTQELEDPNAALADTEALGGGTKESPDTNGPKLTEEEAGAQGAKVYRESEKSIKPQVEEEQQKPEGELAEP